MYQALIKLVVSQGVFAALFVYLLFYVLKENSKRGDADIRVKTGKLMVKLNNNNYKLSI